MKIAVFSDSHGYLPDMRRLAPHLEDVDLICHCGDGYEDGQNIANHFQKPLKQVRGNCDMGIDGKDIQIFEAVGKRFVLSHGHLFRVKQGLEHLAEYARQIRAEIVLYGHTHRFNWQILNGIQLINPGNLISTPRQPESTFVLLQQEDSSGLFIPRRVDL